MVYKIVFKKRFQNKLDKLLTYIDSEFGLIVAQNFASQLNNKFHFLQLQPFACTPSANFPNVRSILIGRYNRMYYKIESDKIVVINIYDTRIHPKRNRLK
ncbi:MAG TPA: type II toxin-antitoxin system RelE/ParE family toxin [Segetibacter sp.]